MTESHSSTDHELNEAIAHFEQLCEGGRNDGLAETQLRFPACAEELAQYDRERCELMQLYAPLRQALSRDEPPPPIDGYHDLKEIGRGGMGIVYLARQQGTDREVAIKLIRGERLAHVAEQSREEAIQRFLLEARATRDHQHIVRVYHVGEVGRQPYLVMEFVRGRSLREWIREGRLTLVDVVDFIRQAAEGLHHAHRHGILHRDIKPANLLIDEEHRCLKVADFGLAKFDLPAAKGDEDAARPTIVGTLPYMSPEQCRDSDEVTVASDIYGLGATLYEALTGRPPATPDSPWALGDRPAVPAPRELNSHVPRALERICQKCLASNPVQRFASAAELASDLRELQSMTQFAGLFVAMGWMLFAFGLLAFAMNAAVFWMVQAGTSEIWVWTAIFAAYPLLFIVFWRTPMPARVYAASARRELWSIWIGHVIAVSVAFVALRTTLPGMTTTLEVAYPIMAGISAMSSVAMGANFWRGHYLLAAGWVATALAMLATPHYAPLEFGAMTALASWVIGALELHLLRDRSLEQPLIYPKEAPQPWGPLSVLSRPGSCATSGGWRSQPRQC